MSSSISMVDEKSDYPDSNSERTPRTNNNYDRKKNSLSFSTEGFSVTSCPSAIELSNALSMDARRMSLSSWLTSKGSAATRSMSWSQGKNNCASSGYSSLPSHFFCPFSKDLMTQPVIASDGKTYDRTSFIKVIRNSNSVSKSKKKGVKLTCVPNKQLEWEIDGWIEGHAKKGNKKSFNGVKKDRRYSLRSCSTMTPSIISRSSKGSESIVEAPKFSKVRLALLLTTSLLLICIVCMTLVLAGIWQIPHSCKERDCKKNVDKIEDVKNAEFTLLDNAGKSGLDDELISQPIDCDESTNFLMELHLITDNYAREVSWNVHLLSNWVLVASSEIGRLLDKKYENNKHYLINECLPLIAEDDCYSFTISDVGGDGICCGPSGIGMYSLFINGNEIMKGGDFDFSESVQFGLGDCGSGKSI